MSWPSFSHVFKIRGKSLAIIKKKIEGNVCDLARLGVSISIHISIHISINLEHILKPFV